MFFLSCVCYASVYMCLVVTCWERAGLLALLCGVLLWVCYFPICILGQVWYLIVSIPDLCTLTYLRIFFYFPENYSRRVCKSTHKIFLALTVSDTYEPRHDISNNVVCATSRASDQPAHTPSLIRAFASRLNILWIFSYWPNSILSV